MIRSLIRLVVLPALIILHILEWCGMYIIRYSGMLCRLVAGTLFTLVVIGFATGLGSREYLIKILTVGFGLFLIPHFGEMIVKSIALAYAALVNLIQN